MRRGSWRLLLLSALLLPSLQGCAHHKKGYPPTTASFAPCDCRPRVLPRGRLAPSPLVPGPPPGVVPSPAVPPPARLPTSPPAVVPDQRRFFLPDSGWQPSPQPRARLTPPEFGRDQVPGGTPPPRPPVVRGSEPDEPPTLPVDIPQFAIVKGNVAAGQKPFPDGLNWLKEQGYRTVLHVKPPGEDDAAARRQFEAKGFRYLSLDVSPLTLDREVVAEFNRIVTDTSNHPLFVYDRDSSLAGGLWYLHLRIVDDLSSVRATNEAARLGLNPDAEDGPHREMWLAVQNYLSMGKVP